MKIIAFSGTTFPTVMTLTKKSLFCSVCKLLFTNTILNGAGGVNCCLKFTTRLKLCDKISPLPEIRKNKKNKIGITAKGKYFLFLPKLMALPKGIGCKVAAFCSIEAKSSSDWFRSCDNCKKLVSLSPTSLKWFPIIFDA